MVGAWVTLGVAGVWVTVGVAGAWVTVGVAGAWVTVGERCHCDKYEGKEKGNNEGGLY